jgi:uncharacterized protein
MLDQFRSLDIIQSAKAPFLILHGTADQVVPFAFGERLFQAAPEPKHFVRIEGGNHTRNLEQGGLVAVNRFLVALEVERPEHPLGSSGTPTP